jgi:hypothetical protein
MQISRHKFPETWILLYKTVHYLFLRYYSKMIHTKYYWHDPNLTVKEICGWQKHDTKTIGTLLLLNNLLFGFTLCRVQKMQFWATFEWLIWNLGTSAWGNWVLINNNWNYVRLEDFTVVNMNNAIYWDVTPCGYCKNRHFAGTYCLYHQGDKNWLDRNTDSCHPNDGGEM